eukprot:2896137-Lingulodinium_polyedra.AAC.1
MVNWEVLRPCPAGRRHRKGLRVHKQVDCPVQRLAGRENEHNDTVAQRRVVVEDRPGGVRPR